MTKLNYILLFMLSFATHTHLHAAQMNVEVKEQEEKQLSAEQQKAVDKIFEIIDATNKDNAAQQAQVLQKLLRYPRIVDAKNNHGWTPLMYAALHGKAEIVQLLIAAGAQIDAQSNSGWTPLIIATGNGNAEIAQLLIAASAQIDAQDNYGTTPLMFAVWFGHAEIVKLLIAAGAQLDVRNSNRNTALDIAISYNRKEVYDNAVTAGLAEKERYEQAQQVAKQKITEVMFPDEIEEPEMSEIIGEYAYNPKITGDLPQETPLEKAQRITKKIQEKKKQKALNGTCRNKK